MIVCDKITVRYKKDNKVHTIVAGTPFNEGDIPVAHIKSLRKGGLVRDLEIPKPQETTRSLVSKQGKIKLPDKGNKKPRGLSRNQDEKVFDNDPADFAQKSMAELRLAYAQRCVKFNMEPKKFAKKEDLIFEMCKDNAEVKVSGKIDKPEPEPETEPEEEIEDALEGLLGNTD